MAEDEPVTRREFDAYKHYIEQQRESDMKALGSQVSGIGSIMATHFEDDRRSFDELRKQNEDQSHAFNRWFIGLTSLLVGVAGGIIAVLIR